MKKITLFVFIFFFISTINATSLESVNSPIGYWKTIDDVTGQPKSVLKIRQIDNGSLYGQVIKIFPRPQHNQNEICEACTGERHRQRIVGMVIMEDLKQNADDQSVWDGGKILDPLNGKVYHCYLQVSKNGQELHLRGYIGVPLFGRSQTWIRVAKP
jgi:uncharacterized protein (DUF2147 family)